MEKNETHNGWANSLKLDSQQGAVKIYEYNEHELITHNVKQNTITLILSSSFSLSLTDKRYKKRGNR